MRFLTAGESHGPQLTMIIEGLPSQFPLSKEQIDEQLARRQKGYGRGRRMQIEMDQVQILSGMRGGKTTGAPLTMVIENKDWVHWKEVMDPYHVSEAAKNKRLSRARPGHADLNGAIKYGHDDMRNVLERSSARETASRVAIGAVARQILGYAGIECAGYVHCIGEVCSESQSISIAEIRSQTEESPVRCMDKETEADMIALIDKAKKEGNTLGGIIEVVVDGVPIGLGSHVHWDRKLDAKIAQAVMSIHAIKGVEFGMGFEIAKDPGSKVQDEIFWSCEKGFYRQTNRLGGFEGGMTTGEPIIVRAAMKPLSTLYKPLQSVDMDSKEPCLSGIERSDVCAVPAAAVVMENVVAWEVAQALLEKFPADRTDELGEQIERYREWVRGF